MVTALELEDKLGCERMMGGGWVLETLHQAINQRLAKGKEETIENSRKVTLLSKTYWVQG